MNPTPDVPAKLDDRYGRSSTRTRARVLWSGVAIGALALIVAFGWMTLSSSMNSVRADDLAMNVVDERTVEVTFQVSGPTDREIACALEALDPEFGVVGWRIVVLPPSPEHTRAFRETLQTTSEATTGLVNSCWVT